MTTKSKREELGIEWDFWFEHPKSLKPIGERKEKSSYYFIFSCETNAPEYVSNSILDVLGYKPEEFTMEKIFSIIHPDDLEHCKECEKKSLEISNNLYHKEHYRFIISYTYRVRTTSGKYINIKQDYHSIEMDEYGRLLKNFVLHEHIEDYDQRPEDDFKVIDRLTNRIINIKNKYKLTKRELEIVELLHQGQSTKQISEKLFLSEFTVKTHRKNILQKTNSNSIIEAINKART